MVLRKLALKSILNFGKYGDYTVTQLMQINKHMYLVWCYYNCSHISFLPEILEMLDITEDRSIEKPGKDPCFYEEHKYEFSYTYDTNHMTLKHRWNKLEKISITIKNESVANRQNMKIRNRNKNQNTYGHR